MFHAIAQPAARLRTGAVLLLTSCLLLAASYVVAATSLDAELHGDASAVLRFLATDVTAEISGTAAMDGTLAVDDQRMHIAVRGVLAGQGNGDSYTLAADGWVVFDLAGADEARLRGALQLAASGINAQDPSGGASGTFVAVLEISDDVWRIAGTVAGTASGAVVAPEIRYTMQVEATYELALHGDATSLPKTPAGADAESLIPDSWPVEARTALRRLFEAVDQSTSVLNPDLDPGP